MPTRTAHPARPRRGPLRSPLPAAPHSPLPEYRPGASPDRPAAHAAVPDPRSVILDEFDEYLRTVNNRDGRAYEETTINAYVYPARALDAWMTANGLDSDFTTVDTALLNRYFREYYQIRGQGGTHTQQRNLIQLFNYLQREYGHSSPYAAVLNRYAEVRGRPKTLSPSFVDDLREVTGGGKARDFETARDHPSSGSCAARESAGRNCSAWTPSLLIYSEILSSVSSRSKAPGTPGKDGR
jgi:hypothetical protein